MGVVLSLFFPVSAISLGHGSCFSPCTFKFRLFYKEEREFERQNQLKPCVCVNSSLLFRLQLCLNYSENPWKIRGLRTEKFLDNFALLFIFNAMLVCFYSSPSRTFPHYILNPGTQNLGPCSDHDIRVMTVIFFQYFLDDLFSSLVFVVFYSLKT